MLQRNAPVCADGLLWWQIEPRDGKAPQRLDRRGIGLRLLAGAAEVSIFEETDFLWFGIHP